MYYLWILWSAKRTHLKFHFSQIHEKQTSLVGVTTGVVNVIARSTVLDNISCSFFYDFKDFTLDRAASHLQAPTALLLEEALVGSH